MSNLENQIKQLIIDSLGLEDITVADIGSEDPLFGDDGLGLDSVDALELVWPYKKPSASSSTVKTTTCVKTSPTSKLWPSSSRAAKHKGERR